MMNWFDKYVSGVAGRLALLQVLLLAIPASGYGAQDPGCQPLVFAPSNPADKISHGRGLLWKVTGGSGNPSFVFGTIHLSDPEILDLPAPVTRAFSDTSRFVMEVQMDAESLLGVSTEMFYADGSRLSDQLEPALFQMTANLLVGYGISAAQADSIKPWAAYLTLNMPPPKGMGLPLDMILMLRAVQQGSSVQGLETVNEQIEVLSGLAMTDQISLLRDTVCNYDILQTELLEMKALYLEQDLAALMRLSEKYAEEDGRYARLMDRVLWQRNQRMVERMIPVLEKGGAFVAIGALHLPGRGGVLDLLEQNGYEVKREY